MSRWAFEAIGTAWQIDTPDPVAEDTRAAVEVLIEGFDRIWSRFRADSVVTGLGERGGEADLGPDAADLLDLFDDLAVVTGGAVTPLVGRTLADLGYDPAYSLRAAGSVATIGDWSRVRRDGSVVRVDEPTLLDVGAAGKGRLVDRIAEALAARGHEAATVDGSGDLLHTGTEPLRVALEHPRDPSLAIGVVELGPGEALCGSATNRRTWGDGLHHVLDGRTGRPTTDVVATWVISSGSCMIADGLATAHFFAEPDVLTDRWEHRFVRVRADGRVHWSPDLRGEVFR